MIVFLCLQMTDGLTKQYIEDYCIYRIRKHGVELEDYQHVSQEPSNDVSNRIRQIGKYCLQGFFSKFLMGGPNFFSSQSGLQKIFR